jgi:valyl-tRNA synthetase
LAGLSELTISAPGSKPPQSAAHVGAEMEIFVPLAGVLDLNEESARLKKEIAKVDSELSSLRRKLENPNFMARAPAEVVEKDRSRVEELGARKAKLEDNLERIAPEGSMNEERREGDLSGAPLGTDSEPETTPPHPGSLDETTPDHLAEEQAEADGGDSEEGDSEEEIETVEHAEEDLEEAAKPARRASPKPAQKAAAKKAPAKKAKTKQAKAKRPVKAKSGKSAKVKAKKGTAKAKSASRKAGSKPAKRGAGKGRRGPKVGARKAGRSRR